MSQYFNVVPWFNSKEWMTVYTKVCEDSSDLKKQEALDLLLVWKARCPSLPSGIESTLSLLDVTLEDNRTSNNRTGQDVVIRLAFSTALMRFVNHMLDNETARGSSLYQAARNLDVPDWIIDLRHDTAHSNNLPSIQLLREAANISLNWLKFNYWERHKAYIKDYIAKEKNVDVIEENRVAALMNFCLSLSICSHSQCKIKSVADIPDLAMRESVINDIQEFFGHSVDLKNLKTVSIYTLIGMLYSQSKRLLRGKDINVLMKKALLGEDSLFLSLELADLLGESNIVQNKVFSKHFAECFEVLLTYLHVHELLLDFVVELINLTQKDLGNQQCHLAAIWVNEILKALGRTKAFQEKMKLNTYIEHQNKSKEGLKQLFFHWFPNEKECALLLDLQRPVPQALTDIDFIQPIISTYNPYLTYFIRSLLNLLDPKLPKETVEKICSLAELVSSPRDVDHPIERIFTTEDLQSTTKENPGLNESDSDCVEITENEDNDEINTVTSFWKLASSEYNWSVCPIGVLPWQIPTDAAMDVEN